MLSIKKTAFRVYVRHFKDKEGGGWIFCKFPRRKSHLSITVKILLKKFLLLKIHKKRKLLLAEEIVSVKKQIYFSCLCQIHCFEIKLSYGEKARVIEC